MGSMRRGWRAVATLALITTLTGGAVLGMASASQAASAKATASVAAAATPVSAPGILAPPDVVVGAADGSVNLKVALTAPGTSPVSVGYSTYNGTTASRTACSGTSYGYVGQQGILTFEPGVTSQTIRIPLLNCGQTVNGTFYLSLADNSADSTIARAQTTITETP
jgi:hypothetical protein